MYVTFVVTDEVNRNARLSLAWSRKHAKRGREDPIYQGGRDVSAGYVSCCAGPWSVHAPSSASTANSGSVRTGRDASRATAGSAARSATYAGAATARFFGQQDRSLSRSFVGADPHRVDLFAEIPDAANWSNQHAGLSGDALANAIRQDNLPWDPSVLALLPFPQVLQMMVQDPGWTQALGDAVLAQRPDVMDAVQRMRQQAYSYGYLRPNSYDNVVNTGDISRSSP